MFAFIVAAFVGPESARWLCYKGYQEASLEVISSLKGRPLEDDSVKLLHRQILDAVDAERSTGSGSWRHLLLDDSMGSRRRVIIAYKPNKFTE